MPRRVRGVGIRLGVLPLGDYAAAALEAVGVTKERVSAWLGRPCKCPERQEKLNQWGAWLAQRFGGGDPTAAEPTQIEQARSHLEAILDPGVAPATGGAVPPFPQEQPPATSEESP